jgi:hypothetical protein
MASAAYRTRLDSSLEWALSEGSRHFEGKSAVHAALHNIARRLDDLGIPYAVAGAMAMFSHGYRRFTEDIDLLVTADGLKKIHDSLEGLGYVPLFLGSKSLRDVETGVVIEFLVAGQFPGDGNPKPVSFPDPSTVSIKQDGISYLTLPILLQLKLASGMTHTGRLKDLADVQELIKNLKLPIDFADQLDPFVREKYREIWKSASTDDPQIEMNRK